MHRLKLISIHALIFIALPCFLCGCSATIKNNRNLSLQSGSPLQSVSPKEFAFTEFHNATGVKPGLFLRTGLHTVVLQDPVETLASDAIKRELERNGHKCRSSQTPHTDFLVRGSVLKYQLLFGVGWSAVNAKGIVAVNLTISRGTQSSEIFNKSYEGEVLVTSGLVTVNDRAILMGDALMDMVKKISTDEQLIAFLGKN